MIPLKPKFIRILVGQCEGIITIPSLDFITDSPSLFCNGFGPDTNNVIYSPSGNQRIFSPSGNAMVFG